MSTGDYYRFDLHKERARRLSILAQPSRVGRPRYLETADLTDWARITRKALQRVAQVATLNGVDGAEAWKLEATADDNNFIIKGGDNTDDGAKAAWLGGLRALLYRNTDYNCTLNAPNEQDLFAIHHKATAIANNLVTDTASKYAVNALVGYEIHIEGAGEFTVTANTPSTITLAGFNPGDYGLTDASRPYYWIVLKAPVAGATQAVYLDVHIEDWGMAEDAELNHNPRGAPVEWARREVLIQRIFVNQNNEMPVVDYNDSLGRKHYVLKIGAIVRQAGDDAIPEVNDDNREDQASSAQEIFDARGFAHFEVGVDHNGDGTISSAQPTTLADRLAREESLLVVGPNGDPGIYTGPDGLLEALAINTSFSAPSAPHTVFLRNGFYDFSGKGTIVVPAGWTLVGESRNVRIGFDPAAEFGMQVESGAKVENIYLSSSSADNPGILLAGSNSHLGRGATLSRCTVTATISNGDTPAILVRGYEDSTTGVVTGGTTIRDCQIFKSRGLAVKVELRNVGAAVQNSARAAFSNGTSGEIDSYHVNIENCRIYSGRQDASAGAFKRTNAALNISTHASVLVNRTLLVGDENPALYISGSNATTFRHQVFFSDCTFLGLCRDGTISGVGVPSLVSPAYQPFTELDLARVEGGSSIFDSCLWDTCHPGALFSTISTGPKALLSLSDEASGVPLACQVASCRFEVVGGTATSSQALGFSAKFIEAGSMVEVTGCTARSLNSGYPSALYYMENWQSQSIVAISDSSADCGESACAGFYLVGSVSANDIKATGGSSGNDLILTRAQVNATGSVGLRIDTINLSGIPLNNPSAVQVNGFKAFACGGVGVALLGNASSSSARANLSNIIVDGLYGTTSATSIGVVLDSYFGVSIANLSLGGIKSCGVFCSDIDLSCAVNDVTVYEVGTAQANSTPGFQPWHAAALVNVTHSRNLKFFNRARSVSVPAKMYLGAYYSGGSALTQVSAQGFDIQQALGGCNGIQVGRTDVPFLGTATISNCSMEGIDRAILVYEGAQVKITACSLQNFRTYAIYISGPPRVEVSSCDIRSVSKSSLGITASGGFGSIILLNSRVKSDAKAFNAQLGSEVSIFGCILECSTAQTVSIIETALFELESTKIKSTRADVPTAFPSALSVGCSLICSKVSVIKLKQSTMKLGATVSDCYKVYAERCDFSTEELTGLVVLPPAPPLSTSGTELKLVDCRAWGNPVASDVKLKCAVWAAPIRDFGGASPYSRALWGDSVIIEGGEYTASSSHGNLGLSADQSRAAIVRLDVLNVAIKSASFNTQYSDVASVIAGNMDYVETEAAAPALYSYRFGVDRFQFRNNEISGQSGVVIAVLEPGKPHEVRDNLFRSSSLVDDEIPERNCFYITTTEDEDGDFGTNNDYMTRVLYTGNCHMIMGRELPEGQLSLPKYAAIVTSYSVCLDAFGNLQREVDAVQVSNGFLVDGAAGPNDEYLGMVEKLNSIRRLLKRIQADGTLADERLRLQEW